MPHTTRRTFLKVSGAALGGIAVGTQVTAAERTDRFIVETKGGAIPQGVEVIHEMPGVDVAIVEGSSSALEQSRSVKDYAPDIEIKFEEPAVNDEVPAFQESDYEGPGDFLQWDKADLNVSEAFEITEGEGTRVSVIDSGILETHPDVAGPLNTDLSMNFTGDGGDYNPVGSDHGTHVGGIIAADNGGGFGVNGTAPKTDLVACRVFSGPFATFGDILAAIVYSVNIDSDVANLSLGAYPVPRQAQGQFYGGVLNRVMTYANKEGMLLAIAAGNDSADLQHDKYFISLPNEGAQAVSVSATGPIGYGWGESGTESPPESPAIYTNFGTNAITLGAPGGDADLSAIGSSAPWYYDLVFNAAFSGYGKALVAGTFGPRTEDYPGDMNAQYVEDGGEALAVRATGQPPYTTDSVPWYSSVGIAGVRVWVDGLDVTFTGEETVSVDYETESAHQRLAPDWISMQVSVGSGENETTYVVVDWRVDEPSGTPVSWNGSDSFGDGTGGIFEAESVEEIFENPDIDPTNPNASFSDVEGGTITSVGVFSGGGIGNDESVDILYTGLSFNGVDLFQRVPLYGWKAGTSMAAPQVAGAAALVKSANPNYNANQIESALKRAAEVPEEYGKEYYGSGYLNILDAL